MTRTFTRRVRNAAFSAAAVALLATPLAVAGSASADPAPADADTVRLRAVTARYNSVAKAVADGFTPTEECAAIPGVGGMGYHYVNLDRVLDGVVDPDRPDILLYMEDDNGNLRLAGLEWIAIDEDQDLTTDAGRPSLFGRAFDGPMPGHELGAPIHFDLHAWVWEANPNGTFAPWNSAVTCD